MNTKKEIRNKNILTKTLDEKSSYKFYFVIGCFLVFGFFDENINSLGDMFTKYKVFWYYFCSIGILILIILKFVF